MRQSTDPRAFAPNMPDHRFTGNVVLGNRQCGVCPTDLPGQLQAYCGRMTESVQG